MKLRSRLMLCLLSMLSVQASGQESGDQEAGEIADVEAQFLFINMLEFLGEFETKDGDWISPDILSNDAFSDLDVADTSGNESSDRGQAEQRVLSVTGDEDQ